jgi:SH3-like domain-containing protein
MGREPVIHRTLRIETYPNADFPRNTGPGLDKPYCRPQAARRIQVFGKNLNLSYFLNNCEVSMHPRDYLSSILFIVLSFTIVLLSHLPATAGETTAPLITTCECSAYVANDDPEGINMRSGPGEEYAVIGTLPTDRPVEVLITGSVGEWLRITDPASSDNADKHMINSPSAWVYGPLLAVRTSFRDYYDSTDPRNDPLKRALLYAKPSTGSTIVAWVPRDTEVAIVGCWWNWLKVRYGETEAWLDGVSRCADPLKE